MSFKKRAKYTFDNVEIKKKRHAADLQSEIIAFLKNDRSEHSFLEIKEDLEIDIAVDRELLQFLSSNPKVALNSASKSLWYKPTFPSIKDKASLLYFFQDRSRSGKLQPTSLSDLGDSYDLVENDVEELVANDKLYKVYDEESKETLYFFKDSQFSCHVDEDIRSLWKNIEMPSDIALEQALVDAGMLSLAEHEEGLQMRKRKQKVATQKQRKGSSSSSRKARKYVITNTHMMDQLAWLKENGKLSRK